MGEGYPTSFFPQHQNCNILSLEQQAEISTAESDTSSIDLPPSIDFELKSDDDDEFYQLKGIIKVYTTWNDANFADKSEEVYSIALFTLHLMVLLI